MYSCRRCDYEAAGVNSCSHSTSASRVVQELGLHKPHALQSIAPPLAPRGLMLPGHTCAGGHRGHEPDWRGAAPRESGRPPLLCQQPLSARPTATQCRWAPAACTMPRARALQAAPGSGLGALLALAAKGFVLRVPTCGSAQDTAELGAEALARHAGLSAAAYCRLQTIDLSKGPRLL